QLFVGRAIIDHQETGPCLVLGQQYAVEASKRIVPATENGQHNSHFVSTSCSRQAADSRPRAGPHIEQVRIQNRSDSSCERMCEGASELSKSIYASFQCRWRRVLGLAQANSIPIKAAAPEHIKLLIDPADQSESMLGQQPLIR